MSVLRIQYELPNFKIKQSELNTMYRKAYAIVGKHWQAKMLPGHFLRGAIEKYKYQKRDPKYVKYRARVAAKKGRQPVNLVLAGDARDASGSGKIMARKNSVSIGVPLTHPVQPFVAREVAATTDQEMDILSGMFVKAMDQEIKKFMNRKVRKNG